MDEQTKEFLKELSNLSNKYNRYISSSWEISVDKVKDGKYEEIIDDLMYDEEIDMYCEYEDYRKRNPIDPEYTPEWLKKLWSASLPIFPNDIGKNNE